MLPAQNGSSTASAGKADLPEPPADVGLRTVSKHALLKLPIWSQQQIELVGKSKNEARDSVTTFGMLLEDCMYRKSSPHSREC